ncbi:MAG: hypothetical protein RL518_259 [Pseudomonadota bacterium]
MFTACAMWVQYMCRVSHLIPRLTHSSWKVWAYVVQLQLGPHSLRSQQHILINPLTTSRVHLSTCVMITGGSVEGDLSSLGPSFGGSGSSPILRQRKTSLQRSSSLAPPKYAHSSGRLLLGSQRAPSPRHPSQTPSPIDARSLLHFFTHWLALSLQQGVHCSSSRQGVGLAELSLSFPHCLLSQKPRSSLSSGVIARQAPHTKVESQPIGSSDLL